jgi:3-dehydroquinate synthase
VSGLPSAPTTGGEVRAKVVVPLAGHAYEVLVGPGLLGDAVASITARLGRARCAVVTDGNVAPQHLPSLERLLRAHGLFAGTVVLTPGEATKSFAHLAQLCERLLEVGLERRDLIIALGGGVVGDVAGFAASVLRRGIRYVQLPTSLLAQVDSSIGGKTAINTPQGKNLVGSFHQPSLVLADTQALATLPAREFRAGYVEAAKYALLGDAAYFAWLERNQAAIFAGDPAALCHAIASAVAGKARIVAGDERETSERMLLNLGHTFGHALEAWAGFSDRLLHGEAIAIGICLAFRLSAELGLAANDCVARVEAHFSGLGLPTAVADIAGEPRPDVEALLRLMGQDKKVADGRITLILVRRIGEAFASRDVPDDALRSFLSRQAAMPRR